MQWAGLQGCDGLRELDAQLLRVCLLGLQAAPAHTVLAISTLKPSITQALS